MAACGSTGSTTSRCRPWTTGGTPRTPSTCTPDGGLRGPTDRRPPATLRYSVRTRPGGTGNLHPRRRLLLEDRQELRTGRAQHLSRGTHPSGVHAPDQRGGLLAAVRNLASVHPVAVLLRRHFEGTMSINKLAVELLTSPAGRSIPDRLRAEEHLAVCRAPEELLVYRQLPAGGLPAGAPTAWRAFVLPLSRRRPAGLDRGTAVGRNSSMPTIPLTPPCEEISSSRLGPPRWLARRGGKVRDFGATPGRIEDRNDLVAILTMVIWTAGPQHAAVNFSQLDPPPAGEPAGRLHSRSPSAPVTPMRTGSPACRRSTWPYSSTAS